MLCSSTREKELDQEKSLEITQNTNLGTPSEQAFMLKARKQLF